MLQGHEMGNRKDELYDALKLKVALDIEGVSLSGHAADKLREEKKLRILEYCAPGKFATTKKYYDIINPARLKHDFGIYLLTDSNSPYELVEEGGVFGITHRGKYLTDISFDEEPEFYGKKTKDGTRMKDIARDRSNSKLDKSIVICYSEECAVKDKGQTCLFCTFNAKKKTDGVDDVPVWKYPHQIGETVKAAYDEGYKHLTITGGFIPERRELEYYLDVAESIKEALGTDTFNGTACIGAPLDFSVIDKYKEAGFSTIAFNTEVWGKQYFEIVCPGKVEACGGYDNWIKAIEYAVQVFGKGRVRSNFVAGLQPKEVLYEGFEYLASIGVVTIASSFKAYGGSPLEGHRTPTVDWHWEMQLRHAQILQKYGRTYEEVFNAAPARFPVHDILQIEDGSWQGYKKEVKVS